jgi:N6-adenosine-specific RNA methylase IME4
MIKGGKRRLYEILYVDFPWPYTPFGTARLDYASFSWEQLCQFPWDRYMAERCVVFWWTTGPFVSEQMRCFHAWQAAHKLRPLGIAYRWVKTTKDGKPIGASGPRPTLVKPLGEDVHAFTNVPRGRPFPLLTESQVQTVFAPKACRGEHSTKPDEVPKRIVELLGDRPRAELFGRKFRPGWDVIGDESPHIQKNLADY